MNSVLKQQIIGVINLSVPLVAVAYFFPTFFFSMLGMVVCAIATGLYVYYLNYKLARNQVDVLQFEPSGAHQQDFAAIIKVCGMQPSAVRLRYAFSNEMIASATFNTIVVDPLIWGAIETDPQAVRALEVINTHIMPLLSEVQKKRTHEIKQLLTPQVQRFLFIHELGHVAHVYSHKKLVTVAVLGSLAALSGILAAKAALDWSIPGVVALFIGMVVGGTVDILLGYLSNAVFKAREEKNADMFAVRFCSKDEVEAAAKFFEQHQRVIDVHGELKGILAKLPTVIVTGYYDGGARARYLRQAIR